MLKKQADLGLFLFAHAYLVLFGTKELELIFLNQNIFCGYSPNSLTETVIMGIQNIVCLFASILYSPVNNFPLTFGWFSLVEPVLSRG